MDLIDRRLAEGRKGATAMIKPIHTNGQDGIPSFNLKIQRPDGHVSRFEGVGLPKMMEAAGVRPEPGLIEALTSAQVELVLKNGYRIKLSMRRI